MTRLDVDAQPDHHEEVVEPRRGRVVHLFWVREGKIAAELGVDVRHLCGFWSEPPRREYAEDPDLVEVVGGLVPIEKPRDCRNCLRVLEAAKRRSWEAELESGA